MEPPKKRLKISIDEEESVQQLRLPQLPEEVLQIIFSYLTDARDLKNVRSVSRQFSQILKASRVKWMFLEVLKISLAYEKEKGDFAWREQWKHFNTLRLVCKSWKRAVNNVLENDPSHFSVDWNDPIVIKQGHINTTCPVTFRLYEERLCSSERERIERFTNYFVQQQERCSAYNPIPTRHLHIRFQRQLPSCDWEAFSQHVTRYLQAFGKHVWYLTLGDSSVFDDPDLITVYNYLSEWVRLMPNVKSLVLDFFGGAEARQLRSFPYLKDLTTCQFGRFCDSAYHVLKKNTHIRKLSMMTNSHNVLPKIMKIKFTHPLELTLSLVLTDELFYVRTISCQIHTLRLECVGPVHFCKRFMMLFRMLKRNSLESLDLDMSQIYMLDRPFSEILDLPNLKHLRFKFPENCMVDLDWFLGNLESLESLILEVTDINKVFVSRGSKDDEDISYSDSESDGDDDDFDGVSEDEQANLDGEMPDEMEKEDVCKEKDLAGNEVIIVPVEKTATVKAKKNEHDYMVDFHQASLWKNLSNLENVQICTSYFGWKQEQYILNRPGMPTLTFEMFELEYLE